MLDIDAFHDVTLRCEELSKQKKKRLEKNREEEKELEKLTRGKSTFASIFMNNDQIEHKKLVLADSIANAQQDLFDWE